MSGIAKTSIKAKLLFSFIGLIVVIVLLLEIIATRNINRVVDEQLTVMEEEFKSSVERILTLAGEKAASDISSLLNQGFTTTEAIATALARSKTSGKFSRTEIKSLASSALVSNPKLSSLYTHFEANAYDGLDAENAGVLKHSGNSGSIEIYWVRENGQAVYYETENSNDKYNDALNASGIREAEWYLCSRDTKAACTLDPYLYEIEPGKSEMMTSLVSPVIFEGEFIGIVGTDINLPIVQAWVDELASNLFKGKASISVVSKNKLLVASNVYSENNGKSLDNFSNPLSKVINTGKKVDFSGDTWFVNVPIIIEQSNTQWELIIGVSKSVALANVAKLKASTEESQQAALFVILLVSIIIVAVGTALAFWLATSLVRPISAVSDSIDNLSSSEGDLSQTVNVNEHRELILLAENLNKFIEKLATIISTLKDVSAELVTQFERVENTSENIGSDTRYQQENLDSVATAINEMSATALEVAGLASSTAKRTTDANDLLNQTQVGLKENVDEVNVLASSMEQTSSQISQVASRSQEITSIVSTIQSIAEQTNLLALNAAIEAARAGDQGRGFAVVADEVRSLAARTQTSTQEISELINNLQGDVDKAVENLDSITATVVGTVDKTNTSYSRLSDTIQGITEINDSVGQVATAAEEQSVVSEELSERVVAISDSSTHLASLGQDISNLSVESKQLINAIDRELNKFQV